MTAPPGAEELGDPSRVGEDAARGLRWSLANQIVARLISLATGIVLARILVPEDFGVYASALAVMSILIAFNELGLVVAVVRAPKSESGDAATASTIATVSSLAIAGVVLATAPWIVDAIGSPSSAGPLRLMMVAIVLDGLTSAPNARLVRAFRQDRIAAAELAAIPTNLAVSITLALAGAGVWSLAIGFVSSSVVSAALMMRLGGRPEFGWDPEAARRLLAFGVPLAGTSLVEHVLLNVDYLIIGATLDEAQLGLYLLAFNISSWPITVLSQGVRRVSIAWFAALAERGDDIVDLFRPTVKIMFAAAFAASSGLWVVANPLVSVVYGSKWLDAAEVLTWLALLAAIRVGVGFAFDLIVAVGQSAVTFVLQLAWLAVLVPALIIGVDRNGIVGAAIAHLVVAAGVGLPAFAIGLRRVGVPIAALLAAIVRPALAAVVAVLAGLAARDLVDADLARLLLGGAVVTAVYALLLLPGFGLRSEVAKVMQR